MKRPFLHTIVYMVLLLLLPAGAMALSWNIDFGRANNAGNVTLFTPLRDAGRQNEFTTVNSSFNQPRDEGTTPHQGVDLKARIPRPVYPLYYGWIEKKDEAGCEIFLYVDLNRNNLKDDNLYVKYDHLSEVGDYPEGARVNPNMAIGKTGSENGTYRPHLHFGLLRKTADGDEKMQWVENEPFYRGQNGWNAGRDLDYVKQAYIFSGIYAMANVYGLISGKEVAPQEGEVIIFHRKQGGKEWQSHNMLAGSDNWFYFDFSQHYPIGTTVEWMVKAVRNGLPDGFWNTAFYPQKFYQPDPDPNNSEQSYDFMSNTLKVIEETW